MIVNRVPDLVAEKFGGPGNINFKQVERETGLNYSTVSSWINDDVTRVDFAVIETWCRYLNVSPGDILVLVETHRK